MHTSVDCVVSLNKHDKANICTASCVITVSHSTAPEIHPVRPYLTSVMPLPPLPYIHCIIREWQTSSPLAP